MGKALESTVATRELAKHSKAYFAIACANVMRLQSAMNELEGLQIALENIEISVSDMMEDIHFSLENAIILKDAFAKVNNSICQAAKEK